MPKQKILMVAAIALIIAGLALAGYPLYLGAQSYFEQRRLEKAFQDYVPQDPHIEDEKQPRQDPPQWQEYEPVELPQWDDFPPTRMEIPALDISIQIVALDDMGIFAEKLNQLPSYYPSSSFPGEVGNVTIAGHRGGPAGFVKSLEDLKAGNVIILHTPIVSYHYEVEEVFNVEPTAVEVIAPLDYAALTITTCKRVGSNSSAMRTIVRAKFIEAYPSQEE